MLKLKHKGENKDERKKKEKENEAMQISERGNSWIRSYQLTTVPTQLGLLSLR